MTARARRLLCCLLTVLVVVTVAPSATAAPADTTAPALGSWSFTPTTVDISTAAATVTARFTITDATAVKTPYFVLDSDTTTRPSASAP